MKKIIAIATALAFLPALASAASFTNVQFDNGDVTISGTGAETVNATFRIVVPNNQVVEWVETDVLSDNLAPVCVAVNGDRGLEEGTHSITLPVKLPPNTGTYSLQVKGAGIFGGFRSVDCNDNVVGTASFSSALRVVSGGSTTGSSGSSIDALTALIATLKAQVDALMKPTTPVVSTACATLATKMAGAMYGVNTPGNVILQGYLLGEGMSIPALAQGAAFGFYGSQTAAALSVYKSQKGCI